MRTYKLTDKPKTHKITEKAARKCPIHSRLFEEAEMYLETCNEFSFQDVIKAARAEALVHAVQWGFIRKWLEDSFQCKLMPVSSEHFKVNCLLKQRLAGGGRRATAGYALANERNEALAREHLRIRKAIAEGHVNGFKVIRKSAVAQIPAHRKDFPQLEFDTKNDPPLPLIEEDDFDFATDDDFEGDDK